MQLKRVLILGSGGLRIGQAGEFDYSGSQAIKALKEEGITSILINPNIATVQTDGSMADKVYLQPLNVETVERIINQERPDGLLLSFGGQTALNLGLKLDELGILKKYGVRVLGTAVETIRTAEDRNLFKLALDEIGVKTARSFTVTTVEKALEAAAELGYPVMIRSGFSLGGLGSGRMGSEEELRKRAAEALSGAPQVLIEEYLGGWKEVEYEIVRDQYDNCLTVCNMENFDPMGIHTGESIVVAPSQTLTNEEFHLLREVAIRTARHLKIVGECNIQYALDPKRCDYRVIELNPRLSRSSALASKATGYPLAFVATKLALGFRLDQMRNAVTQKSCAFFEPALDYLVVKIPRWDIHKLKGADRRIGSEMKSVGEVMAIGRSFPEALQKAIRMLNIGATGFTHLSAVRPQKALGTLSCCGTPSHSFRSSPIGSDYELVATQATCPASLRDPLPGLYEDVLPAPIPEPKREIAEATDRRLFALADHFQSGGSVEEAHQLSQIDPWFLHHLQSITALGQELKQSPLTPELMRQAKRHGYSDQAIGQLTDQTEEAVRTQRIEMGITPHVKQIDTLAGEFDAETNYLYTTYWGQESDVKPSTNGSVVVLGSGPYCIGSSVEFDWCAVNTARTLRRIGTPSILINSNPETVSTDYDESDRLYFEELSQERVRDIADFEQPKGIIVSVGGQIANNLAVPLDRAGYPVLGTPSRLIDQAENRQKFSTLLTDLGIDQPAWEEVTTLRRAKEFAQRVGYPILVRPSYVLSGAAMNVVGSEGELESYLHQATLVSPDFPVVISQFITDAKELEIDGVGDHGEVVVEAISEHVENAGVHSGDATVVLPPQRLYLETIRQCKKITRQIAKALEITGPFNIQFIAKNNSIKVIECNLRASRSFPFVSKVTNTNFIEIATEVIMGIHKRRMHETLELDYVGVKTPQFSYNRLKGANPVAHVEMASTGEVAALGETFLDAFYASWRATEQSVNEKRILVSIGGESKHRLLEELRELERLGWEIYATDGTHRFLSKHGVGARFVFKARDLAEPNVSSLIANRQVSLIVNIPRKQIARDSETDGYLIRRLAIDYHIPLVTNLQIAPTLLRCLTLPVDEDRRVKSWQEFVGQS